jgi:hypothetical protein
MLGASSNLLICLWVLQIHLPLGLHQLSFYQTYLKCTAFKCEEHHTNRAHLTLVACACGCWLGIIQTYNLCVVVFLRYTATCVDLGVWNTTGNCIGECSCTV